MLQHVQGRGGRVDPKEINGAKLRLYYNVTSPKDKSPHQSNYKRGIQATQYINIPLTCKNRKKKCCFVKTELVPNLEKEEKRG